MRTIFFTNTKERKYQRSPEEYPEESPEEYPEESPEEYPEESPKEYPEESPEEYPEESPEEYPEESPEKIHEEYTDESSEQSPKVFNSSVLIFPIHRSLCFQCIDPYSQNKLSLMIKFLRTKTEALKINSICHLFSSTRRREFI